MDYNCQRQTDTADGLQPFEILDLSKYLIWQLVNNTITFVSRPSDPKSPCVPVYCHYPQALVTICNNKPDPINTPIIMNARDVGMFIWDLYRLTLFDSQWLTKKWEGGFRPCRDPGSATTDPLVESFKAWAKWTADDWEIVVSKEPDDSGCDKWRGAPEWLTTGGGRIPPYVPDDFYAGIPTLWHQSWDTSKVEQEPLS
ncbi:hypothetical protein AA313_de0209153 [Arthrobotrys entomopaga]|nr:hypothetical protein AA313_de0209153 [Arthrobotrys entomopaga]